MYQYAACYSPTVSQCHSITMSQYHSVTVSQCLSVTTTISYFPFIDCCFIQEDSSERLIVHHFYFLSWPDHGVPHDSTPFLLFRRKVKSFFDSQSGPLLVHCRQCNISLMLASASSLSSYVHCSCYSIVSVPGWEGQGRSQPQTICWIRPLRRVKSTCSIQSRR